MNRILNAHLLPEMADPHALAGHTSVVIDVLRASTTITTALAYGASRIIPCLARIFHVSIFEGLQEKPFAR